MDKLAALVERGLKSLEMPMPTASNWFERAQELLDKLIRAAIRQHRFAVVVVGFNFEYPFQKCCQ